MSAPRPTAPAPRRLRVAVDAAPRPALLRAAIAARLAGRPVPAGPERKVAEAVAAALWRGPAPRGEGPWR